MKNWLDIARSSIPWLRHKGHFERFYTIYNDSRIESKEWMAHFLIYKRFLPLAEKVPTLDLGCGCGAGTKLIADNLDVFTTGIDYSKEAIDFARKHNTYKRVRYLQIDLRDRQELDFLTTIIHDKGIKQVFFIETIEHLKDPKNIVRFLFKAGIKCIFVSTPYEREKTQRGYHMSPFTPEVFSDFSKIFDTELITYCKYIDAYNPPKEPFTKDPNEALNYLFKVQI